MHSEEGIQHNESYLYNASDPSLLVDPFTTIRLVLFWTKALLDVLGVMGNVIAITVLARRKLRCSTSMMLISMCLYDSVFLASELAFSICKNIPNHLDTRPIHSTILHVVSTGSVYTAVAVMIERYVAVRHPLKILTHCHIFRMWKPILGVFIVSIGINLPRNMQLHAFEMNNSRVIYVDCYDMSVIPPHRFLYCSLVCPIVVLIVPFVIILVLNVLIVKTLSQRKRMTSVMTSSFDKGKVLTRTALGLTSSFFVCCTFPGVYYLTKFVVGYSFGVFDGFLESICFTLLVIKFSTNFILYCFLGKTFRHICLDLFCNRKQL